MLSSQLKGSIVENRIVEIISLHSKGELTCYLPNADDDGLDIIVNKKGEVNPVFLQVKSRFNLSKRGARFNQNVNISTHKTDERLFYVFVYFNSIEYMVDTIWLVPSKDFAEMALGLSYKGKKSFLRFNANPRSNSDKWSNYIVSESKLCKALLNKISK